MNEKESNGNPTTPSSGLVEVFETLCTPRVKPRRSGARLTVTVYDEEVLEAIQEWATKSGTNVSSVVAHALDLAANVIEAVGASAHNQQSISQYMDSDQEPEGPKPPRLDDPVPVWMEYLSTYKDLAEYERDVELPLRRVISLCNDRYGVLSKP